MKRSIRPFAVEVRRGRKGAPSWPALSESVPGRPKPRLPDPRPALTPQLDEASAPPAWIGARILPDLTPARPANERQLSTLISVKEQQDEAPAPRQSEAGLPLEPRQSEAKAAQQLDERRAKLALRVHQRRERAAQAADSAVQQEELAEALATVGAKVIARARKGAPASAGKSDGKPDRSAFRRGERWKARLPAVVTRKHAKRQWHEKVGTPAQ